MRVKVNPVGIINAQKLIVDLGRNKAKLAVSRALKRATTSVAKEAAIRIRDSKFIRLSSARAKKRITTSGTFSGNISMMEGTITMSNKAESLADFYARKVAPPKGKKRTVAFKLGGKKGKESIAVNLKAVSVKVYGKTFLAGKGNAFLINKNGVNLVVMRKGHKRMPLKKLYGPSFSDYFIGRDEGDKLSKLGEKRFKEVLAQEISYRLSQSKTK